MSKTIIVLDNSAALSRRAAHMIAARARQAIADRGRFSIALAGGSTVKTAYELLADEPDIDWKRVLVFWGDDRFVEPTNPYSNYGLAKAALLDRVPIPAGNIYAIDSTAPTPAEGAARYADTIRKALGSDLPVFDLVQLGMGPDGHTASLFPGSSALDSSAIVAANHAGLAPWVDRVTFTFPLINAARKVLVLAGGANKAAHIQQAIENPDADIHTLPIAGVNPTDGILTWLIDRPAATLLSASTITSS
ncbi:MAG TPA: 6-phosphogluconolactonase [Capsulimonadaceae bacterium]|jgi:6-phosphogluconolactonase